MNQDIKPEKHAHIAIVDDNEAVCRSLSLLLRSKGYDVSVYDSGLAFLNRQTDTDFDCVLIDFKMAPHDGLELLREMRELGVATPAAGSRKISKNSHEAQDSKISSTSRC